MACRSHSTPKQSGSPRVSCVLRQPPRGDLPNQPEEASGLHRPSGAGHPSSALRSPARSLNFTGSAASVKGVCWFQGDARLMGHGVGRPLTREGNGWRAVAAYARLAGTGHNHRPVTAPATLRMVGTRVATTWPTALRRICRLPFPHARLGRAISARLASYGAIPAHMFGSPSRVAYPSPTLMME